MSSPLWFSRFMILVVAFALCGGPQLLAAEQNPPAAQTQSTNQDNPETQTAPDAQTNQQNVGTSPESATPDPSKGPLAPNNLPNAPSASQQQQQPKEQTNDQNPSEAPLGAAAAQAGKTSGGAASKPAGTAIAPAKQRQTRSLLIKIGAVAAGAAAVGIIYGLSRGTPSVPPGANTATTTAATAPAQR
jgi:hypothetical protein